MFDLCILLLFIYSTSALEQDMNFVNSNELRENENFVQKAKNVPEDKSIKGERVPVELYYETLCPYSMEFYTNDFVSVVKKLSPYLKLTNNPYGNAKTFEKDGKYTFECQHGPIECYGNKLHACSVDVLQNITKAVIFNACMITKGEFDGSNDNAADACGKEQNIDVNPIKECAKGDKGTQLLKTYGDASKKVHFAHVPCIYINGNKEENRDKFMEDICAAFANPPPPCQEHIKELERLSRKNNYLKYFGTNQLRFS